MIVMNYQEEIIKILNVIARHIFLINIYLLDVRKCSIPTESCRLSNPPCSLKEVGINRFDPLYWNPQEKALERFDRIGVNYRMVAKDNHTPLIETPDNQEEKFMPRGTNGDYSNDLNKWAEINKNNQKFSPGYPYANNNEMLRCS